MKYQIGNLVLVKDIHLHLRLRRRHRLPLPRPLPLLRLHNTCGIITAVEKHTEIFQSGSTEGDNGYIWFSQVEQKEYYFYEDEVTGEAVK